ncbi:uncharacterized protein LOC131892003 isoform X3 [Tigriopus californicus]|uniref:uncharacterized protein LOC131892003 isoform X3 n=1 Tax=Tigriopus californicus TaxID=6832 RepID=UPI0027DA71CF|nr:uncharacterized protein LOC131892003 isoform X3 [Tigriopus californicus]
MVHDSSNQDQRGHFTTEWKSIRSTRVPSSSARNMRGCLRKWNKVHSFLAILVWIGLDGRSVVQAFPRTELLPHPLAMDDYGFVRGDIRPDYANSRLPYRVLASNLRRRPLEGVSEDELIDDIQELNRRFSQSKRAVSQPPPETLFYNPFTKQNKREKHLKELYEKIAKEFPFVAKQGLNHEGKVSSLNDLFAMTIFGQPQRSG